MPFERIIGAAFLHPDKGVYSLPAPARHGQVSRLVDACYPETKHANIDCEQGFVTDRARFVSREEAWELVALEMANTPHNPLRHYPRLENYGGPSVPKPNDRGTELFSEDLW
ncbi:hypothetical protein OIU34_21105 [Pararhizobium sp. BT-229]|uniref:hypothetical protein n=1 Tax=Pararhizobium sp. BT-229 TaxID=2986923 RepID=UPI0021F76E6F|nr:hypothetical protein [Pararhizobium sp. BT-229]MCV9964390.1 hypothetical protein [Pararhizobium sp. BT-229]